MIKKYILVLLLAVIILLAFNACNRPRKHADYFGSGPEIFEPYRYMDDTTVFNVERLEPVYAVAPPA